MQISLLVGLELAACPPGRSSGALAKIAEIELPNGGPIMVTWNANVARRANTTKTLTGLRPISHNIAETPDLIHWGTILSIYPLNIIEDRG
jgi:hypothetical protein